jgi:hypothetical protein
VRIVSQDRLPARFVASNSDEDEGNVINLSLEKGLSFLQIDIAFEGIGLLNAERHIKRIICCSGLTIFNICRSGINMRVSRNNLILLNNYRE